MSKKKFSLGAILQKLNEENNSPLPETASFATAASQSTPKHCEQPSLPDNLSEIESDSNLPDQPKLGFNKPDRNVKDTEISSPVKKPAQPDTPVPAIQPITSNHPFTPAHEVPQRHSNPDEDEEEFDILKYVGIILRRKNVVLLTMIVMALFSVFKFLTDDKYYIANARLLFRPGDQEMIGDGNFYKYFVDREKTFSTHLELLRSNTVLTMVSQNLDNTILPEIIKGKLGLKQGETNGIKNDIIELSFKHANPDTARDVLNELCRTYIDYRREVNTQELTRFIFKFETQINKLQNELDIKENDLRRFKEDNQMIQLSSETNLILSKLSETDLALQKTQLSLLEAKERLSALNSQINLQDHDIIQSITYQDPFQTKIAALELELNSSTAEYSSEHFKVKTLKQQIENLKAATIDSISREAASKTLIKNPIRQSLLQDLINLTIEKSALEAKRIAQEQIIEKLNCKLLQLPSLEQRFANLQRETESQIQTLRLLKTKYEEAKIKRDSQESDLKLLELAQTPTLAMSNVRLTNIIVGILIGLILGITLVFLIEYLDQSLKDPADVEKELELPLLGVVPLIEAEQALIEQSTDLTKTILEPFRALRANLKHIAAAHELKTFMVCSAVKGEGKTTLAANLAITFALDGKSVILIDADLRRSQMHTLFAIQKQIGVADYLLGTATVDEIIKPTRYPNLSVVTSGERPHNPAELLGTIRFDLLIEELRGKAEIVIFDSPALLPVSDTITMAPKMDCCVVVVRTLWTPLKAAKQAKNQLKRIGCRLYGGILNGVSHAKGYYPYYYGYYGYYSYKYTYEDDLQEGFSLRNIGLQIENSLKNKLLDVRFALPKHISTMSRGIRSLTSKKRFWVLLLILISVTGMRLWYQANYKVPSDSIRYLGIAGGQLDTAQVQSDKFVDMASGRYNSADSSSFTADLLGPIPAEKHLKDSINLWVQAKNRKNHKRYLSFYDSTLFEFPGGSFKHWSQIIHQQFLQQKKDAKFNTTFLSRDKIDSLHQKYTVDLQNINGQDTTYSSVIMIWRSGSDGWRIIREKTVVK